MGHNQVMSRSKSIPRVYVSGQAEKGKNLAEATRLTLEGLRKTLAHLVNAKAGT